METLSSPFASMALILAAMAVVAAFEVLLPLREGGRQARAHLTPNLALTFVTFAMNAALGGALVFALAALEAGDVGLLRRLALAPAAHAIAVVLALDLSFYLSHVAMHRLPLLWRFHRVHHADPAVDVTTTFRQHPGEALIRYVFLAGFACALGASPAAFVVYRMTVALTALLEHANLRVPARLDRALSWVVTWPNLHKVHHARDPRFTDTNYGNLVSWWDRLFGTFTPSWHGVKVAYGLDGFDDPAVQTTAGLLRLPFEPPRVPRNRRRYIAVREEGSG